MTPARQTGGGLACHAGLRGRPVQAVARASRCCMEVRAFPVTGLACPVLLITPGVNTRFVTFHPPASETVTLSSPVSVLFDGPYQRKLPRP